MKLKRRKAKDKAVSKQRKRSTVAVDPPAYGIDFLDEQAGEHASPKDAARLAGHGTVKKIDDQLIVKATSQKEIAAYENYASALDGAIPAYYPNDSSFTEPQRSKVASAKEEMLARQGFSHARDLQASGRGLAVMENLQPGNAADQIVLDIKIGRSTASKKELRSEKSPSGARNKKLKMALSDRATGSRSFFRAKDSRGWRVIPQTGSLLARLQAGRKSPEMISEQLATLGTEAEIALEKIDDGLRVIEEKMTGAEVTFIASSVLIVIDKHDVRNTRVTLIDLAHPIAEGEPAYPKYRQSFLHGLRSLSDSFRRLAAVQKSGARP